MPESIGSLGSAGSFWNFRASLGEFQELGEFLRNSGPRVEIRSPLLALALNLKPQ